MRSSFRTGALLLFLAFLVPCFVGCQTPKLNLTDPILGRSYEATNVFRAGAFPPTLRKVAVLPLVSARPEGPESAEPALQAELAKADRFELVLVERSQLLQWTRKSAWSAQEVLPADFLSKIEERTACEGVLFSELTRFKAYPPLAIGWRFKLVDIKTGTVLWSADEVFDAGDGAVVNGARRYANEHLRVHPTLDDSRSILISPSRFASYTASTVFATLPNR